ncbi:MAG: hypothetical protein ACI4SA_08210 [Lachnospiraceae bacterium]
MDIDIEAILMGDDEDALKELKLFLFKETVRLQNEKKELKEAQEKLIRERTQFRTEMDLLNHKMVMEHKRLKDENLFFEKKMEILQDGYRKMEEERTRLEKERFRFKMEQDLLRCGNIRDGSQDDVMAALFKGVNNPITLRKRYKDLLKIFHPDNLCGDEEMVQLINREYERRKRAEQKPV